MTDTIDEATATTATTAVIRNGARPERDASSEAKSVRLCSATVSTRAQRVGRTNGHDDERREQDHQDRTEVVDREHRLEPSLDSRWCRVVVAAEIASAHVNRTRSLTAYAMINASGKKKRLRTK